MNKRQKGFNLWWIENKGMIKRNLYDAYLQGRVDATHDIAEDVI